MAGGARWRAPSASRDSGIRATPMWIPSRRAALMRDGACELAVSSARMRQIIIDTETTGLDPQQGHRIIELAALEVANRRATGRTVHFRIDPEREIDAAATEVHGMTWEDLKGKPKFREIAAEFIAFAQGAEWIIHNAPFDLGFLDFELRQAMLPCCNEIHTGVVDTLALARDLFPGKRNSLDALCERFSVDNAHRSVHGALLDAQLLADVYLTMTRGQETLTIDMAPPPSPALDPSGAAIDLAGARKTVGAIAPLAEELELHRHYLLALEKESAGRCLWLALDAIAGLDTAPRLAAA
jgi:DNA polymerase-3 subunit epsilon